jgi:hypothetical protein
VYFLRRAIIIVSLCAVPLGNSVAADDRKSETVACKAVNKLAKVGVFEGTVVGLTIIDRGPECRFSINGADVGSPPYQQVLSGINSIIGGRIVDDVRSGRFDGIAFALLAASPDTSIQSDLSEILRSERRVLEDCFRRTDVRDLPPISSSNFGSRRLICGRVDPVSSGSREIDVRAGGDRPITLSFSRPVLVIGVSRSNQSNYLVVPAFRLESRQEFPIR